MAVSLKPASSNLESGLGGGTGENFQKDDPTATSSGSSGLYSNLDPPPPSSPPSLYNNNSLKPQRALMNNLESGMANARSASANPVNNPLQKNSFYPSPPSHSNSNTGVGSIASLTGNPLPSSSSNPPPFILNQTVSPKNASSPPNSSNNSGLSPPPLSQIKTNNEYSNSLHKNRKDAYQYIEKVKATFVDSPHIYNIFLEIMKEFKAKTIDANIVVAKVSTLFEGFPELIEGFNAFLPPENRISISQKPLPSLSNNSARSSSIDKSSESGPGFNFLASDPQVQRQHQHHPGPVLSSVYNPFNYPSMSSVPLSHRGHNPPPNYSSLYSPYQMSAKSSNNPPLYMGSASGGGGNSAQTPLFSSGGTPGSASHKYSGGWNDNVPFSQGYGSSNSNVGSGFINSQRNEPPNSSLLYNPSIHSKGSFYNNANNNANNNNIVTANNNNNTNSINHPQNFNSPMGFSALNKMRKHSLGHDHASEYFDKIRERFYNQPEVCREFVEILRSYELLKFPIEDIYTKVTLLFGTHYDLIEEFTQFLPNAHANFHRTPSINTESQNAKDGRGVYGPSTLYNKNPDAAPLNYLPSSFKKALKNSLPPSMKTSPMGKQNFSPTFEHTHKKAKHKQKHMNFSFEELEFFEEVKKHLKYNDSVYAEFLKCLNWYTHDIIKRDELVELVKAFIGTSTDLFSWFKQFINYYETDKDVPFSNTHNKERGGKAQENSGDSYFLDLSSCKKLGSYRRFPKNYKYPVCSGRTALCNEVLNDILVSCPSFNSEDSTFVSSKKNIYEEALFRCEDERYELDRLIDGNQATIIVFEPLSKKLELLSVKDAEKISLDECLGGTSEVIYRNIIQKVYGNKSEEVLEALTKTPSVAVSIVLKRLKQKDEEWRSAQREWNKIWREVHFKNYYKALDNQGANFKSTDKKVLSSKSLVNEIQTIYYEQIKGNLLSTTHLLPSSQGLEGLTKNIDRTPSLSFISGLFDNSKEKSHQMEFRISDALVFENLLKFVLHYNCKTTYFNSNEKRSIEKFILNFIPDFFSYKARLEISADNIFDPELSKSLEAYSSEGGVGEGSSENTKKTYALFEPMNAKLRLKVISNKKLAGCYSSSNASSTLYSLNYNLIYGNEAIYSFFRLFQIAYHRLEKMKSISKTYQENPTYYHKKNEVACFLDPEKKHITNTSSACSVDYYGILTDLLRQLLDGSLESVLFEEKMRLLYGTHAYLLFTFDKVIYSLLKQALVILTDTTNENIVALYDSYKRPQKGSYFSEYSYKVAVKSLLLNEGIGYLFRIESQKETKTNIWWIRFKYLTAQSIEEIEGNSLNGYEKWALYVDKYIDTNAQPVLLCRRPLLILRKHLKNVKNERLKDMIIIYNLECKICVTTFKMFFVDFTEDFIYKPLKKKEPSSFVKTARNTKSKPGAKDKKKEALESHVLQCMPRESKAYNGSALGGGSYSNSRFRKWLENKLESNSRILAQKFPEL